MYVSCVENPTSQFSKLKSKMVKRQNKLKSRGRTSVYTIIIALLQWTFKDTLKEISSAQCSAALVYILIYNNINT